MRNVSFKLSLTVSYGVIVPVTMSTHFADHLGTSAAGYASFAID